jgi:tripartite-type tricarboxylate transporter receptor subunit TctC
VAQARPDGYTLLAGTAGPFYTHPHIKRLPYDPVKDFVPIGRYNDTPLFFYVHTDSPWRKLDDLLHYAKSQPAKSIKAGTVAKGSIPTLTCQEWEIAVGVEFAHVPFKGAGQQVPALLGKHIDIGTLSPARLVSHHKAGKIRLLCIFSEERSPEFPDVPTARELGYDIVSSFWRGLFAPAGTPRPIVAKLRDALKKSVQHKSFSKMCDRLKEPISYLSGEEFGDLIEKDYKRYGNLIRRLGLSKK